ncbi:hypothetical protein [Methylobacterium sp. J-077]|uniref:hypothetical protein n=1 Tax=Methylobacterium sp. J-077 TaxID=2836656 RepID=UPI001FBA1539|nr:hypothetical protein [Methylobacterium sp. J-077]MCJ2126402.1 hypothetical protein [Methylobacterium sp. J-077]
MAERAADSSHETNRGIIEPAGDSQPGAETRQARVGQEDPLTRIGRMLDVVSVTFEQLETAARGANDAKDAAASARWANIDARLPELASDATPTLAQLEGHTHALAAQVETSRVHLNENIAALRSQLDSISQQLSRLIELREQADIHHTGLFGLLLNGQNQLQTDLAEVKHWVTRSVLRGSSPEALNTPPASGRTPQPTLDLTQAPDAH